MVPIGADHVWEGGSKYLGSIEDMEGPFGFGFGGGPEVDAVSPCGLRSISGYMIIIRVERSILSSRDFFAVQCNWSLC